MVVSHLILKDHFTIFLKSHYPNCIQQKFTLCGKSVQKAGQTLSMTGAVAQHTACTACVRTEWSKIYTESIETEKVCKHLCLARQKKLSRHSDTLQYYRHCLGTHRAKQSDIQIARQFKQSDTQYEQLDIMYRRPYSQIDNQTPCSKVSI